MKYLLRKCYTYLLLPYFIRIIIIIIIIKLCSTKIGEFVDVGGSLLVS